MALRFVDGDVVVSGTDANTMAGLAFVGFAAIAVVSFRIGKVVGEKVGTFAWEFHQNLKTKKLNK